MEEIEFEQIKDMTKDMDRNQKIIYYETKKKNEGIAVLLSILIAGGGGQLYLGKIAKGIIIILLSWLLIPYIYGIYDAYKTAKDYNARLYLALFPKNEDRSIND